MIPIPVPAPTSMAKETKQLVNPFDWEVSQNLSALSSWPPIMVLRMPQRAMDAPEIGPTAEITKPKIPNTVPVCVRLRPISLWISGVKNGQL